MNISSAIVYVQPTREDAVRHQLLALAGVEIHGAGEGGKWIVTMEVDDEHTAISSYQAIERLDGVLAVSMIFQQTESHPDQELPTCN